MLISQTLKQIVTYFLLGVLATACLTREEASYLPLAPQDLDVFADTGLKSQMYFTSEGDSSLFTISTHLLKDMFNGGKNGDRNRYDEGEIYFTNLSTIGRDTAGRDVSIGWSGRVTATTQYRNPILEYYLNLYYTTYDSVRQAYQPSQYLVGSDSPPISVARKLIVINNTSVPGYAISNTNTDTNSIGLRVEKLVVAKSVGLVEFQAFVRVDFAMPGKRITYRIKPD